VDNTKGEASAIEAPEQAETGELSNPFDGVVRDHTVAWQHVSAAYGITFLLLFGYVAAVTFRLRNPSKTRTSSE